MPFKKLFLSTVLICVLGNVSPARPTQRTDTESLKNACENLFFIGTAVSIHTFRAQDTLTLNLIKTQFNSITPENSLKWEKIHPRPDQYHFEPADSLVAFAMQNGMQIIGHTLVWHSQTPRWVFQDDNGKPATREVLLERLRNHIHTVVGRYKGKIHGWDVVNEAVNNSGLRPSPWKQIIGDDYIEKAFEFAHEADPDAELYYNDYSMYESGKVKSVLEMIERLQKKGIPIHGIGLQAHWGLDNPHPDTLEACIRVLSSTGLKLMFTEMDVSVLPFPSWGMGADIAKNSEYQAKMNPYSGGIPDSTQQQLAEKYAEFFRIFCKYHRHITRITFWGAHDGLSWKNNWPIRGRTDYPLLFDRRRLPKPAYDAVIRTVENNK